MIIISSIPITDHLSTFSVRIFSIKKPVFNIRSIVKIRSILSFNINNPRIIEPGTIQKYVLSTSIPKAIPMTIIAVQIYAKAYLTPKANLEYKIRNFLIFLPLFSFLSKLDYTPFYASSQFRYYFQASYLRLLLDLFFSLNNL